MCGMGVVFMLITYTCLRFIQPLARCNKMNYCIRLTFKMVCKKVLNKSLKLKNICMYEKYKEISER
jgi:hypothetical protein